MIQAKKFTGAFAKSREAKALADIIAVDHMVSKSGSMEGSTRDHDALDSKDIFTSIRRCCPVKSKSAEDIARELKFFAGQSKVGLVYSDGSGEIENT